MLACVDITTWGLCGENQGHWRWRVLNSNLSSLTVSLCSPRQVIWPLCFSPLICKMVPAQRPVGRIACIMYVTLGLGPTVWSGSVKFSSLTIVDTTGLESKKFFHGFCVCIKPYVQPSTLRTFDFHPYPHNDTLHAQNNA